MRVSRELLWLLGVLAVVAVSVAYIPYEVPIPRRLAHPAAPVYSPTPTPDTFSFYCSGNRHARAYTGVRIGPSDVPQYSAESGLLEHP